jgi:hypothetical protein
MKPSTKKLVARFAARRDLYPRGKADVGRKHITRMDKRARKDYGHGPARATAR